MPDDTTNRPDDRPLKHAQQHVETHPTGGIARAATDPLPEDVAEKENAQEGYIVIACFDDATADALIAHRDAIARFCDWQPSAWPPHITLGAYHRLDIATLCEWVRSIAERTPAFETRLSSFAVFPRLADFPDTSVLFAAPASTPALIALYMQLHQRYDEYHTALGWLYTLRYGHPALHSTIVGRYPRQHMPAAMNYMLENYVEIVARVVALEVYAYPMQLLARFPLRQAQG